MEITTDPRSPEAMYDHLDDTGIFDAAEMREMAGLEAEVTGRHSAPAMAVKTTSHQEWVESFHLTHPTSEGPLPPEKTPEQKQQVAQRIAGLQRLNSGSPTYGS